MPSLDQHWERVWSIRQHGGWWNNEQKRKIIKDQATGGEREDVWYEKKWVKEENVWTALSPFADIWHVVALEKADLHGKEGKLGLQQCAGPSWATWDAVLSFYCLFGPDIMRSPQQLALCLRYNGFEQMKLSQEGYINTPPELFQKLKRMMAGEESLACLHKDVNLGMKVVAVSCEGESLAACQGRDLDLRPGTSDWKWISGTAKREINKRIDRFYKKCQENQIQKYYIDKYPDSELTPETEIVHGPLSASQKINDTIRSATGSETLSSELFAYKQAVPNEIVTPLESQSEEQIEAQQKQEDVSETGSLCLDVSEGVLRPVDGDISRDGDRCDVSLGSPIGGGSILESSTGSISSTDDISSRGSGTEESLCEGDGNLRPNGGDSICPESTESSLTTEPLVEDNLD